MSDRRIVERIKDVGQAFIAVAMAAGILGGFAVKAWGFLSAGPEAKRQIIGVEARVGIIEKQMRFVVFAAEKQTGTTYKKWEHKQKAEDSE